MICMFAPMDSFPPTTVSRDPLNTTTTTHFPTPDVLAIPKTSIGKFAAPTRADSCV